MGTRQYSSTDIDGSGVVRDANTVALAGRADTYGAGRQRRSFELRVLRADVAQLVEHSLGKGEVTGSIPVISSRVFESVRRS